MNRDTEFQFVNASAEEIINTLTASYQNITGVTVHPSSPVKVFLSWVAAAILQIYQNINYVANQNLPSRAIGENLDALAQLFYAQKRPEASQAITTMEFTISEAQTSTIIIPAGTRVASNDGTPTFETMEDASIAIGETTVQVMAICQTAGTIGNGYAPGQIERLVDVFPYYSSCTNIDTSDGGSDVPTDDEFYALLMKSNNAYSSAGPREAYRYFAMSVSSDIADVVVNTPDPGEVDIYAMMEDGTIASSAVKTLILNACNADEVRPLTDLVSVKDPSLVSYNITVTYYMSTESSKSAAEIQADVEAAVDAYVAWQCARLGRDINPSKLIQMMITAGAKRVTVTAPVFTHLGDGSDNTAPELAKVGTITLTNGGYEDE